MNQTDLMEVAARGTPDFPLGVYRVGSGHARYIMPFHWHREIELIRVEEGEFSVTVGEAEYRAQAGDTVLVGSGVIHGGTPKDCVYSCVVFDPAALFGEAAGSAWRSGIRDTAEAVKGGLYHKESEISRLCAELLTVLREEDSGFRIAAVGLLCRLFSCLYRTSPLRPAAGTEEGENIRRLKTVLSWIGENYAEPVTLGELAALAGMSPHYFCTFFRTCTRCSPIEYVNMLRVDAACRRLAEGETVTEAALSCGFSDLSYFAKLFRRFKGISPRTYRQSRGNNGEN